MPERLLSIAILVALVFACSDGDPSDAEGGDAAGGHGASAGSFGAGGGAGTAEEEDSGPPLPRGEYLVRHVAGCGECHTPRDEYGEFQTEKWLAGTANHADLDPDETIGLIPAPNITPDPSTGIGTWKDEEILSAMLDGIQPGGAPLSPAMPYYVFHNMTAEDAREIVAYLRSAPPIVNAIPSRQPLPTPLVAPALPIPNDAIPEPGMAVSDPNYESAARGRYLAGSAAPCLHCHTEPSAAGSPYPIDLDKAFMGGRAFPFGHPAENVTVEQGTIYSRNLTPHPNGTAGWKPEDFREALKNGIRPDLLGLCPPMPSGPLGAYVGMTSADARNIGHYLGSLEPRDNGEIPICCSACHKPRDGG